MALSAQWCDMMLYRAFDMLKFVERLIYWQNNWKILRFWLWAKDVCFAASHSRCYGYIFSYFV